MTIKILFLAANPKDASPLRLGEEMRSIQENIRSSEFREEIIIEQEWAVRVSDIQGHLLRHRPHIVHFSGHGNSTGEIILENESGKSQSVSINSLKGLFSILKDNIRCVVLNACFAEAQANAIAEYIDCVIGMSDAIRDTDAIKFAASFYQAIGFGRSIGTAYELACLGIALHDLGEEHIPVLILNVNIDAKGIFLTGNNKNDRLFDISRDSDQLDRFYE